MSISPPDAASPGGLELIAMAAAGLDAVEPMALTAAAIRARDGIEVGGARFEVVGVRIIAFGKAAAAMAAGAAGAVGDLPHDGLIVTNVPVEAPDGFEVLEGGHPMPTEGSYEAGRRAIELASNPPPGWMVLYLVSGGGSSLLALPPPGVSLAEMADLTLHLMLCGADIRQLNTVRRHLSQVKGGRLGAATSAPYATLALSDVVGSDPAAIASGPTVPCPSTTADAVAIVDSHRACAAIPDSIVAALARPVDNPPPAQPYVVIGDGASAAQAAAAAHPAATVVSTSLTGEAGEAARLAIEATVPGKIGVFAGETTVTVTGWGSGGRNQQAALAVAIAIDGLDLTFLALGTDGIDGPTSAAGAIVDGTTAACARSIGIDLGGALADNDSHTALSALDCTLTTGPTGTNVGDLWMVDRR